ncbi:SRPBCC domain-containing protein [Catenulispora subtropica]|uniref:SRPBCC domain-containing protein n=1 Tax=Catenulispora subtropica TaxID=450798 RepID=A0ABN2T163_9ACTN
MPTGQTKDAGWEIGVSKTLAAPVDHVWELLTGPDGLRLWLGTVEQLPTEAGQTYETAEGTVGEIRSYHERHRVRLTWRPKDWDHDTTLQLTVTQAADPAKTRLGVHQEWLADGDERERQREHWRGVIAALEQVL